MRGYKVKKEVIVIDRDLTELDMFIKDFLRVLKKYSDYLVCSGFVSIATGRTRGTEDVDILVSVMDKCKFSEFFRDLQKNGFWCYQGDSAKEVYPYIREMNNIRFAKVNELFPNIEFVPVNEAKKAKFFELKHPQKINIKDFEFNIPPVEFEILYKEIVLGGEKDIADAKHLRTFFSEIVKKEKFEKYKKIIKES